MSKHLTESVPLPTTYNTAAPSALNFHLSSSATRRALLWLPITKETSNSSSENYGDDDHPRSLSAQSTLQRSYHNIRHHGKHHKINSSTYWHRHKFPDDMKSTSKQPPQFTLNRPRNSSAEFINTNNRELVTQQNNNTNLSDGYNISFSDDNISDSEQNAICYTTNEVLIIIGLTCFLNFTFIVIVMTCVHFCSTAGSSRVADFPRLESLVLGDSDLSSKRTSSSGVIENLPNLHDHSDSMPLLFRPSSESMVSLQALSTSFCPLLRGRPSMTPLVQESSYYLDSKIPPSLSMENLLFTN